jgi:hypothetical protein
MGKKAELKKLRKALEFYADPETYFGWAFIPDPPVGDLIEDFSHTGPQLGYKPGKRARAALGWPEPPQPEESPDD